MASSFQVRPEDTVEDVLRAGGGASISARWYVPGKLIDFARLAHNSASTLWLWDTDSFSTDELVSIAKAGKQNVIIDIRTSPQEVPRHTLN
jgi:hypothetical protein